jgi:virulence-associated protein VagC
VVISCLIGVGIALGGFPPINNIPSLLDTQTLPGFVVLTPACLVALVSGVAAWRTAGDLKVSIRMPKVAALAIALILVGASLSLLHSARPGYSAALLVSGLLAPGVLFLSMRSGRLPIPPIAGAFLATLSMLLLRADFEFVHQYGLPTSQQVLFDAKFHTQAYDFHYFTLGNPDHTANFLILPLALSLFWALGRSTSVATRIWLLIASGIILLTITLLYVRFADLVALLVIVGALLSTPWSRRARWYASGLLILAALGVAGLSPGHYLLSIFKTGEETSGTVRLNTVSAGWHEFLHHPLTGLGLGQYNVASYPAHSSIVQAGTELGVFGFIGVALMTLVLVVAAVRRIRAGQWLGLSGAGLVAAALYAMYSVVSPAASEGLMIGFVSIYGLALALAAGIGLSPRAEHLKSHIPVRDSFRTLGESARSRLRRHWLSPGPAVPWFWYGVVWTAIGAWSIASRLPSRIVLSGARTQELTQLLAAHSHGLGPMVELVGPGAFRPAGLTDDPGSYLYVPWLASILHTNSVDTLLRTPYVLCMALLVGSYPYLMWRLTRSRLAALIAPILVLVSFSVADWQGFYWVPEWALAVTVPWLLFLARNRSASLRSVIAIAAIAGVAGTFRANTGLGILVALGIVVWVATISSRMRIIATLLAVGAYLVMGSGILDLAYQARAKHMGHRPIYGYGIAGFTNWSDRGGHPFWHTVYIGLGVVPNHFGISYSDSVAAAYVHSVDPNAAFVSPRYETILRKRVIQIAETDPGFVVKAEARKAGLGLEDGLTRFGALIVLLPLALFAGAGRRRRRLYLSVIAPIALVAFAPTVIAIPEASYELPWFGVLGALTVIVSSSLLSRAGRALTAVADSPEGAEVIAPALRRNAELRTRMRAGRERVAKRADLLIARLSSPLRRAATVLAAHMSRFAGACEQSYAAAEHALQGVDGSRVRQSMVRSGRFAMRSRYFYVTLACVALGFGARDYLGQLQATTTLLPGDPVEPLDVHLQPALRAWDSSALASSWTRDVQNANVVSTRQSVGVVTSPQSQAYQLGSPTVELPAGEYVVVARGRVSQGGLTLGVLDAKSREWVQTGIFTSINESRAVTMPVAFNLPRPTKVTVILANYTAHDQASRWQLRTVSINRFNSLAALSRPEATPSSPGTQPTHLLSGDPVESLGVHLQPALRAWDSSALASSWTHEVPRVKVTHTGRSLGVVTSPQSQAYQLGSPTVELPAGEYAAVARGRVSQGGLALGVLNAKSREWVQTGIFTSINESRAVTMPVAFNLPRPTKVTVILANYTAHDQVSRWRLTTVSINGRSRAGRSLVRASGP